MEALMSTWDLEGLRVRIRPTCDRARYLEAMRESHVALNPDIYGLYPSLEVHPDQKLFDVLSRGNDGLFLGGLSLLNREAGETWELGYWVSTQHARLGYTREACLLLIMKFFENSYPRKKLNILCDSRNKRSCAIAESLGAVKEAVWTGRDETAGIIVRKFVFALYEKPASSEGVL